jgi:hypothetical protein
MAKSRSSAAKSLLTAVLLSPLLVGCDAAELANEQAIGRPCDLTVTVTMTNSGYNASAVECPSQLCIKPLQYPPVMDPPTDATCSGECAQDSDCEGELRDVTNPEDARCRSGFACGVPFEIGPLACKKLCMCKDFFGGGNAPPIPRACQAQTPPPSVSKDVTGVGEVYEVNVSVPPLRKIDMVVLLDNSPTMGPKIQKLTQAFPKMIEKMRAPEEGTLPDLRVAIIDGDLGTGGAYATGACGPKTLPDGSTSLLGDMGRFQTLSSPTACAVSPGALFLESRAGSPLSYSGDINSVFACMAGNLGTAGCALPQPLEAFEMALATKGLGNEAQQKALLRPEAMLGLIFVTDQDDCSSFPEDGLLGDKPELRGESARLRCATLGHSCGLQNLADAPSPGYPAGSSYTHAFSDCRARKDACPGPLDTLGAGVSLPTYCSPLRGVSDMAKKILALKGGTEQIAVAGFFGWPLDGDMASAQYKIAPVPNPDKSATDRPTLFDAWPVCYDPNHLPSPATTDPATGFDATAAAWGATPGLRAAAFIDELTFTNHAGGQKFSVCQPDFSKSMESFGITFSPKLQNLCVDDKLVDLDTFAPDIQADCRVAFRLPVASGADEPVITYTEQPSLPRCPRDSVNGSVLETCWDLTVDKTRCPINGQRIKILRTDADLATGPLPGGTKIKVVCQVCPAMSAGSAAVPGCDY